MLYASVIQLSPAHLTLVPGVAEAMQPFQARAIQQWEKHTFRYTRLRHDMYNAMVDSLTAQGLPPGKARQQINGIFEKAGIEIAVRNFWRMPELAFEKFLIGHHEPPALGFSKFAISGQLRALYVVNGGKHAREFSQLLWGVPLANMDEARPFLEANYEVSAGEKLTKFLDRFVAAEAYSIIPMEIPGTPLRGIPLLYVCALIGAICLIIRERPIGGVKLLWFRLSASCS